MIFKGPEKHLEAFFCGPGIHWAKYKLQVESMRFLKYALGRKPGSVINLDSEKTI